MAASSFPMTDGGTTKCARRGDRRRHRRRRSADSFEPHHRQQPSARCDRRRARRANPVQHRSRRPARRRPGCTAAPLGRRGSVARKGDCGRKGSGDPRGDAAEPRRCPARFGQSGRAARRDARARHDDRPADQEPARQSFAPLRIPIPSCKRPPTRRSRRSAIGFGWSASPPICSRGSASEACCCSRRSASPSLLG